MSKSNRLATVGVLATSTLAFAGAVYFEAVPARAAADTGAASEPAGPGAAALAVVSSAAINRIPQTPPSLARAAAPAPAPAPAPASAPVSLPDFKGQRLSRARREGRKLGLTILARDDDGQRVADQMAPYYRVRRQLTPAGAVVDPGTTVELRVREAETPEGY